MVIEKRMVVEIGAGYDMTAFDPGLFVVSAQIRPGVKTADAMAATQAEIEALANKDITDVELQKAKNLEQSQFVFGQDSIFNEAMMLGTYELLGDYRMLDKFLDGIDRVTAADVQRVVKKYLIPTNRTSGVLIPTGVLRHEAGGTSGGQVRHAPQISSMSEVIR
jgi:zinc protease